MAIFRSYNDLVISFIEYLRLVRPDLDTKPGTVARDLFIDAPSYQLAELYSQTSNIANLQSFFSTNGSDLAKLASNFNVSKKSGTAATGTCVFTTNDLSTDIPIYAGDIVVASNGISFQVVNNYTMTTANKNVYLATAQRLRAQLDLATINDQYAVELLVEALAVGSAGNIGVYSLISHSVSGISSVTNVNSFSGGTNGESDDDFRARILSIFAGSNTGTALGYTNTAEAISGVEDSIIIVPGDPLLTRDGTQVSTNSSGELIVSDPGSGGKVDIYILGSSLESRIDTFIYNDASGVDDATDPDNDYIIGQRGANYNVDVSQRRVSLVSANTLPYQPIDSIVSVSGSSSGPNFVEKYTDIDGSINGNYELYNDTGDYGGSCFGFDKLRWISNNINIENEETVKGTFNGLDDLDFSDITKIDDITQDLLITNEKSTINTASRNTVSLLHTPIESVSRVTNLTTGERYVVVSQNPDGTIGELNTTGNITISGNTLPVNTDILQVDYVWRKKFDSVLDFDNLSDYNQNRLAQDSIDWGLGNMIKNETAYVLGDGYDGYENPSVVVSHNISKVITVNSFSSYTGTVENGMISANTAISNIIDIRRLYDNAELYNTDLRDGIIQGGLSVTLPSDTLAVDGDRAIIRFNATDVYDDGTNIGSFDDQTISLPEDAVEAGSMVLVNYVANITSILPETEMLELPATQSKNFLVIDSEEVGFQPVSHKFDSSGAIEKNLRKAPTNLRIQASSIPAAGTISIIGSTVKKISNTLITVTSGNAYQVDLKSAILSDLGVSSMPSNVKVIRLYSMEKVNIDSSTGLVSSIVNNYDIENYKLKDNSYDFDHALKDSSLTASVIGLSQTENNVYYLPKTGDVMRVTFYYLVSGDSENIYFAKNGEQISQKLFSSISKLYVGSGFRGASGSISGTVSVRPYNQPIDNSLYDVDYTFTAPKENERITITYNHNNLVNTVTESIEDVRPITADVLVKSAVAKSIDVTIRIVLLPEYLAQSQTVLQDATDAITSFLTSSSLGTTIDSSDVTNALYSVQGIDRARILNFSYGNSGNVLSITAENNEYLNAGTVDIQAETR